MFGCIYGPTKSFIARYLFEKLRASNEKISLRTLLAIKKANEEFEKF